MSHSISDFTHQYQLQKTLRFELIPQGKTQEHIEEKGILKHDEKRDTDYKKVKKVIDEYHKLFIDQALDGLELDGLDRYEELYRKDDRTAKEDTEFGELQADLREQIATRFTGKKNGKVVDKNAVANYKRLFSKELIKEDLINFVEGADGETLECLKVATELNKKSDIQKIIGEFQDFTTYFTGFHQNRENMYSSEEKATAIAHRLVHENLPMFIDNKKIYEDIIKNYPDLDFSTVESNLNEVLQGHAVSDLFKVDFFNETLTQRGIERYNIALGGRSEKGQKKIQGVNEHINLYRQKHELKLRQLPNFKPLYKQILSDRESVSFIPEQFEDDKDVLDSIRSFYEDELLRWKPDWEKGEQEKSVITELKKLFQSLTDYDTDQIFIKNDRGLTDISQGIFGDWSIIRTALEEQYKIDHPKKPKEKEPNYEEKVKEQISNKRKHFSIAEIERALLTYKDSTDDQEIREKISIHTICNYFADLEKKQRGKDGGEQRALVKEIEEKYQAVQNILENGLPANTSLNQDKQKGGSVEKIKAFLDSLKELLHFIKPLHPKDLKGEKEEAFYSQYGAIYDQLNKLTLLYDRVRNYVTQKPYSTEKFKLNFESSHFLTGWAQDYNTKGAMIFRKDGNYYLGIVDKKLSNEEKAQLGRATSENPAQRIIYDFQKPDSKNIPRLFIRSKGTNYAPAVNDYNLPIQDVIDIYDQGRFKTSHAKENYQDFKDSLIKLIDYFKMGFTNHESYRHYDFKWKRSDEYENISDFYKDVENSCYQLRQEDINYDTLMQFVEDGRLYLFQIYNKDFSPYSKGKPNLHTLYWRALFHPANLRDIVYKLNGEAEVFFRKKSLHYDQRTWEQGHHAEKLKGQFDYPIISNRRFAVDKFQFHVPLTLNFQAPAYQDLNDDVMEYLKDNPDVNIIGIDRGERHLLYLTLIDQQGNIKKQLSLNEIISEYKNSQGEPVKVKTSYHEKLDEKEKERDEARKSWGTIETIKELKEGYLSQVVHQIAKMVVEYNAIVVLEDLNAGFKRGRQKVEKQVYQKFEKMLIDKLNYLVFKDNEWEEPGGVLNALQLTNKFESFQKMGKQNGILFFVPPGHTSKIDPATGFVNLLHPKYESVEKARNFFGKFKSIRFNPEKQWFEFAFDYNDFTTKAEGTKTEWTICTTPEPRYAWNPKKDNTNGKGGHDEYNVTEQLESLFGEYSITYGDGDDIHEQILRQDTKAFFSELTFLLRITLNLRQTNGEAGEGEKDYILSPIVENGEYFNSEKIKEMPESQRNLPQDADANGAYHIAMKGLMLIKRNNGEITKLKEKAKGDNNDLLKISMKEWLQFMQSLKKQMETA